MSADDDLRERLDLLCELRDSGQTETTVDGIVTKFASPKELNKAINRLQRSLGYKKRPLATTVYMGHR